MEGDGDSQAVVGEGCKGANVDKEGADELEVPDNEAAEARR